MNEPKKIYQSLEIAQLNIPKSKMYDIEYISVNLLKEWIKKNSEAYWVNTVELLKYIEKL